MDSEFIYSPAVTFWALLIAMIITRQVAMVMVIARVIIDWVGGMVLFFIRIMPEDRG